MLVLDMALLQCILHFKCKANMVLQHYLVHFNDQLLQFVSTIFLFNKNGSLLQFNL